MVPIRRRCHRNVVVLRPVPAAMSRMVMPRASDTATWLSAGVRPRMAPTRPTRMAPPRVRSMASTSAPIRLERSSGRPRSTGLTCSSSRRLVGGRLTSIEPLTPTPPANGTACADRLESSRVLGRHDSAQDAASVRQAIVLAQKIQGNIVRRCHPAAPVQLNRARPAAAEQVHGRRAPRPRIDHRLPDPRELTQMRQEALDRLDLSRRPARPATGSAVAQTMRQPSGPSRRTLSGGRWRSPRGGQTSDRPTRFHRVACRGSVRDGSLHGKRLKRRHQDHAQHDDGD